MTDINRILIFILLAGFLYILYKYQYLIFGNEETKNIVHNNTGTTNQPKYIKYNDNGKKKRDITIDNISQLSLGSLDDEDGNQHMYKQDSLLGSLETGSFLSNGSNESLLSKNDSFFFNEP